MYQSRPGGCANSFTYLFGREHEDRYDEHCRKEHLEEKTSNNRDTRVERRSDLELPREKAEEEGRGSNAAKDLGEDEGDHSLPCNDAWRKKGILA